MSNLRSFDEAFVAGALAGLSAETVTHPVDTARVRLQIQRRAVADAKYRGLVDTLVKTVRAEGWRALFRGYGAVFMGTTPAYAVYFGSYESTKRLMHNAGFSMVLGSYAAGTIAEICGSAIWVPMDVVKQRIQASDNAASTVRDRSALISGWRVYQSEGVRGLYRGWLAGVMTSAPFAGTYFLLYESFKSHLLPLAAWLEQRYASSGGGNGGNNAVDGGGGGGGGVVGGRGLVRVSSQPSDTAVLEEADPIRADAVDPSVPQPRVLLMPTHLLSGFLAGLIGAALTNPFDVARTRIQVQSARSADAYRNFGDALRRIAREEGWRGFVRGATARMMWMAPGAAFGIAAYEQFLLLFRFVFGRNTSPLAEI